MLIAAMSSIVGSYSVKAQDWLDIGPGSISWCIQQQQEINAMNAYNAQLQANILRYYRQQAAAASYHMANTPFIPMSGALTYDGCYITPQNVNSYHKERVACSHCNGGYNYKSVYVGNGEYSQYKSTCSFCHGTGTVTTTVFD